MIQFPYNVRAHLHATKGCICKYVLRRARALPFAIPYESEVSMVAIYHCNIANVSRGKGSNSCATLSYISGQAVKDERLDITFDYGRKQRVEVTGTIIPDTAPREYQNPSVLFNAIEKYEKAENSRTAKKIEVALPRELNLEQQQKIVEQYIKNNLTNKGYACTYAIHTDKENNNPHAHILVANRQIDEKGQWSNKRKMEYALDENGQRVPIIDKETGQQKVDSRNRKQWKRISVETNPLDKKETLQELREQWAIECNKYLAKDQQIDHRSYAEQGKDKVPTIHEGYGARGMEQRGEVSERCEKNREIRAEEESIKREFDENRAFIDVLKETDSRLQDLKGIASNSEMEQKYHFAYNTVVSCLEKEKTIPTLYREGQSIAVKEFEVPSKAMEFLKATKEKWDSFIEKYYEKYRESHQNARIDDLSKVEIKGEEKGQVKEKNPLKSLTERFKGWFVDRAREKAEKKALEQEQAKQKAEERARAELQKRETLERLNVNIPRYYYQARLEQLDFVAGVYRENREYSGDIELREQAFQKLGEIAGVKTKEYDTKLNFHVDRDSRTVPLAEIEGAIQKTKQSIYQEKTQDDERRATMEKFRALQEQNRKKISEMQRDRQQRNKTKSRDMER